MKTNKFGEIVYGEDDVCTLLMQGRNVFELEHLTVDTDVNIEQLASLLEDPDMLMTWTLPADNNISVSEFDYTCQGRWFMPDEYKHMDIAEYVLGLCGTQEQLQRCGQELMLFQERNLFDLLRYLKYLVDVMNQHEVIWGVGRGSSVASYVLYKLGVHRIDSMFYDLDPQEFLR
jgi:hypothetical protein